MFAALTMCVDRYKIFKAELQMTK